MMLEHALRYAARGWPVFPCTGKRPLVTNGLLDATTDPATITRWWERIWPAANIAVITGAGSGLLVVDVDGEEGSDSLHLLERDHEPLPRTATVATPRGGSHLYFRHPGGEIHNSAGRLGVGLDVRGDGGYVVVPPSVGANNRKYEPDERAPLAQPPSWLMELLRGPQTGARTPAEVWVRLIRDGLAEGQRNDGLARLVGHLLRRYVDVDLVAELAQLVNSHKCKPPLAGAEVDRIIDSISTREAQRRAGNQR